MVAAGTMSTTDTSLQTKTVKRLQEATKYPQSLFKGSGGIIVYLQLVFSYSAPLRLLPFLPEPAYPDFRKWSSAGSPVACC